VAGAPNRSAERAPVYMTSGSYCVSKSPQSPPTVYKPANAQCPARWFSSGAYACEKF